MYETFFGLKRRPFLFVPDIESYFSIESVEETRQKIESTLQRGEGISLIFGSSGTGKTLLLQLLRQSLKSDHNVILVSNSRLETPRDLILQLFHDLRIPFASVETIKLRLQLLDSVQRKPGQGVILLFDDAQYINPSVLEEIRLLTDSADGSAPPFRAVLAGTMDFEEKLTLPNLETLNQRVVSRCYLDPFSCEETSRYIVRQTDNLRIDPPHGTSSPLFTEEAKRRIYQLTDGVPRLINQLCGTALQFAETRETKSVDGALINDAWTSLQHIETFVQQRMESDSETKKTDSASQEPAISPEQIEEIVDRKRKTFQLRQFDPVEFGTLTDSDTAETEVLGTSRLVHENEYKPPYPEDDEECAELEEPEPEVYRLPSVPDQTSRVPAEVMKPKRKLIPNNFNQQHRKFRRRYLLEKIQHRLGLFAGVLQKTESPLSAPSTGESNMNEKSLQEYGATVLDGRPPFVRKEPHYAYQTSNTTHHKDVTYPDPKTGVPITLRWLPEKVDATDRFGVSYTEFLNRAEGAKCIEPENNVVQNKEPRVERSVIPGATPIVRSSLNASLGNSAPFSLCSGLEESFEESQQVSGSAISMAELFRVDSQRIAESAEFKNLDETVQHQLAMVIRRITKAAEKIEQAADVSERAGRQVSRAAQFVETEVKTALPTYTDLFQQWSEFQNLISAELEAARQRYAEPLGGSKTLPLRRQIMIERTVSAINVEALLK